MLDLLDEEDIEALSKMLMLKGVETVLYLLDESNIRLLQLPKDERHRLLVRHEAKKGASEDSRD
ncbi:transcriptional regulator, partial [Halorubrum sp. Atlit-26R]